MKSIKVSESANKTLLLEKIERGRRSVAAVVDELLQEARRSGFLKTK